VGVRRVVPLPLLLLLALVLPAPSGAAKPISGGPDARPRSDAAAARLVKRSSFEPRPQNRRANRTTPTKAQLAAFRRRSDMPNKDRVTGSYKGTTDEILQWAAYKWRVSPDLLRAVAVQESWWRMSTVGDNGDSFGLMQMRRPFHCCLPLSRTSTAFNVDYYGGILRSYYAGKQEWLNTVPRGRDYRKGDLWGSVGAWFTGRWHLGDEEYVRQVKRYMRERTWRTNRDF
jgi:hypothetical protein